MVLLPVFVQVALTFALLVWMGRARMSSVRRGETKIRDIALRQPAWPAQATQISNCYDSQFQLPPLFYVLVILAWVTRQADLVFVVMAWIFVLALRPRLCPHHVEPCADPLLGLRGRHARAAVDVDHLRAKNSGRMIPNRGRA